MENTANKTLNLFNKWERKPPIIINKILQIFITEVCNLRCPGCFVDVSKGLGKTHMDIEKYENLLIQELKNNPKPDKIVLLGGEPTIHPNLKNICEITQKYGIDVALYTNGFNLEDIPDYCVTRLSVSGVTVGAKPLNNVKIPTKLPKGFSVRLGLDKSNIHEMISFADTVYKMFGNVPILFCRQKRIDLTDTHTCDTPENLTGEEYIKVIEDFLEKYNGKITTIDVTTQGFLESDSKINYCRFSNIFEDGTRVTCPYDIGLISKYPEVIKNTTEYKRPCVRNNECCLQKITLKRKV